MGKNARPAVMAILISFGLQGAIVVVGWLFGGVFGSPIPDGESAGISFSLLGGSSDLSTLLLSANVLVTAVPIFILARPSTSGRLGLIGLVLLVALVVVGPLLLVAVGSGMNTVATVLDLVLAVIAARLSIAISRER